MRERDERDGRARAASALLSTHPSPLVTYQNTGPTPRAREGARPASVREGPRFASLRPLVPASEPGPAA
jgi:hypothetical protein